MVSLAQGLSALLQEPNGAGQSGQRQLLSLFLGVSSLAMRGPRTKKKKCGIGSKGARLKPRGRVVSLKGLGLWASEHTYPD